MRSIEVMLQGPRAMPAGAVFLAMPAPACACDAQRV
jgi:hypothetical protein